MHQPHGVGMILTLDSTCGDCRYDDIFVLIPTRLAVVMHPKRRPFNDLQQILEIHTGTSPSSTPLCLWPW